MSHNIIYEALDIETLWIDSIAKPICIAITANNKIHFKKISVDKVNSDEILTYMLEKCVSNKIYYVHNLTFEMFVFLQGLKNLNVKFRMISADKNVYSAEIYYKNKKIRLRCSYKLTLLSLKKLAELAGVEHKTIFPYKILDENIREITHINQSMFKNNDEFKKFVIKYGYVINTYNILEEYCKNDAYITKQSIIKFWKIIVDNGLHNNNKILTAAKLSIENYFKKNLIIKKKIKIKYDRLIRRGYFGGRTEVFGNPEDDEILLHYDWSGMYAQCMCEKILGGEIIESELIHDIKHPGFYYIHFSQNMEIPVLPIKLNGKLVFANGEFKGWYWFEEIALAIELGVKIISIEKTVGAQYFDYFLKNFVETNNKIRSISPLHKQIGKNNNNTFYGRLGMNPDRYEEEIISSIDQKNNYEKIVEINGVFLGYKKTEKSVANVIVAAAITAKARIKLYKGILEVTKNNGRLIYTDTDSIIAAFKRNTYKNFLDVKMGEVLFDSKNIQTVISDGVFAMPKTYALKYESFEVVKIKGFNNTPCFAEFKEKFYKKESITTENSEWNKKDLLIKNLKRLKSTNLNSLDKRIWNNTQKYTYPLYINNIT